MTHSHSPDLMPILSRGKHRNPRKGACFMELASYLAGERWSDQPMCTHPLLAALARDVNDHVSENARERLAPLIPEVIGLLADDPRIGIWIAREAALTALPLVSAERQNTAAVGLLRCERARNELEGRSSDQVSPEVEAALNDVPRARDWATQFSAVGWGTAGSFSGRSGPAIVHTAVSSIAAACVDDVDTVLVDLLERTIIYCREGDRSDAPRVPVDRWAEICQLTR